ncbi:hypothetical protein HOV30_gp062 [Erwinia phage Derbicus]|uniref:Uncharacterized protein n=2 Tax=Derbicusvirus derbicus TaxID=2734104 RepID=A0A482IFG9_9CAUD|nr:hypothetical protein BIZ82_gp062 [Erwinia phage vB_EamM_EarlPhillipIV]YP_009821106.1 hypothetical protein HOV30_gp062 [Erwinia phage Derbicus]ANZ48912.1 hypothetical protein EARLPHILLIPIV_62 [Erwinia phage vB_EamM_EarlPhillipIV]QBP07488.1 hypothetical protein DERBICUS_62 [Erwinia phage Derbicus]QXO09783.1 hypothetical protein pEaSNUABM38_00061 [Erwinia phage pEa_SNUABM_38]
MSTKSPAFYLFHSWYGWRVPEYATLTQYAREEHGLFLPEDRNKAKAILLNKKTVFMTVAQAAEYLTDGGSLDINDPDNDALPVYQMIMEHLNNWLTYLTSPSLIVRKTPIVGLREMNVLANNLFPVANRKGYFKKPEITMSMQLASFFNDVKPMVQQHRFNDQLMLMIESAYRRRGGR